MRDIAAGCTYLGSLEDKGENCCHRDTTSLSASESLLIPFQTGLLPSVFHNPSDSVAIPLPRYSTGPNYKNHQLHPPRGDARVGTRAKKEQTEPVKLNYPSTRHSWEMVEPSQLGSGQLPSLRACLNLNSSSLLAVLLPSLLFPNKIFVSCCPGFSQDRVKFFCSSQDRTWL